ncbi:MAG: DUF4844 domain-containing protein [Chitinophagales bacterium]
MKSINEIKKKIEILKHLDKRFEIFGASSHKYEFNRTISIEELNHFEEKYKVTLPEDYKAFLNEVGNGGAGPYYGIYPLKKDLGGVENKFELLQFDFPHKEEWNLSEKFFTKFDEITGADYEDDENFDEEVAYFFDHIFWSNYYKDELTYGSIYISNYGCGLRFLFIISGEEKGNIWFDGRADRGGIYPEIDDKENHIGFSDWYINWLNESILKIKELENWTKIKFEEFKKKEKFLADSRLSYLGVENLTTRSILNEIINEIADIYKEISEKNDVYNEEKKLETNIKKFASDSLTLKTEDRKRIYSYFEEIMHIVRIDIRYKQGFMYYLEDELGI